MARNRKSYTSGQECTVTFTADIKLREQLEKAADQSFRTVEQDIYHILKQRFALRETVISMHQYQGQKARRLHSDEIFGRVMTTLLDDMHRRKRVIENTATVDELMTEISVQRTAKLEAQDQSEQLWQRVKELEILVTEGKKSED